MQVIKRAADLGHQREFGSTLDKDVTDLDVNSTVEKSSSTEETAENCSDIRKRKYTLDEALGILVKGAQLAVAEQEAATKAKQASDKVDEQAMIYARDLLKAAAQLRTE